MNLRSVTTSVTVSDEHSVVSTNTAFIQMYLGNTKENRSRVTVKGRRIRKQQMQDELVLPCGDFPNTKLFLSQKQNKKQIDK